MSSESGGIGARFGPAVSAIVHGCSDSFETPKKAWLERKRAYIEHVASVSSSAILVSVSDKIHNVGAIIADYRTEGDALWARFNPDAGKAGTVWYYRSLVTAYRATPASAPHTRAVEDLDRLVSELEAMVGC